MVDLMTRQAELEYSSIVMAQTALEEDSVAQGIRRYDKERTATGTSATKPGGRAVKWSVPILRDAIKAFCDDEMLPGRRRVVATRYLLWIEPAQAAYITVRMAIDGAAAYQKVNTVALAIGTAVEDHVKLVQFHEDAPALYRKVMEQVKTATSARHRNGVLRHVLKRFSLKKLKWANDEKLLLGMKLLELFEECMEPHGGFVRLQRQTEGKHKTPIRLVFTEEAQANFDKAHLSEAMLAPVHQPMIVPPRDWTNLWDGGYVTKAIKRVLVQTQAKEARVEVSRAAADGRLASVFTAVNDVQRTAWRVNKSVLGVMDEAMAGGERFQSLLVEADRPIPPRPAGMPDIGVQLTLDQEEELKAWKVEAALAHENNARLKSQRIAVHRSVSIAKTFSDYTAIYFPHFIDFRGRIYPFANYLNPQAEDTGRGLLEFAEGRRLGERGLFWLKVHIANLFGVDKVSFEERVRWVNAHLDELLDSAALPLDGQMLWTDADGGKNAWQALAACMELAGALITGVDYVSHLPIAMDGSCSGLQHYSAMLRDPIGGAAVNLVPQQKPGDIYSEVARRAQAMSDGSENAMVSVWKGKVIRKIAKQPTMTLCYSATVFGMGEQIEKAVHSLGGPTYLGVERVRPAAVYMASVIWDAIGDTVVAAKEGMAFLRGCSAVCSEAGLPVRWTTPLGLPIEQSYREVIDKRIQVHYKGRRIQLTLTKDGERLDEGKQAAGIAPNFIHSLDSAHLMATVNLGATKGLSHWACIHDSFGVHAADVDTLHACIRESFIEQYTPNVLEQFREGIVAQLPAELAEKITAVPLQGTLDLAAVRDSAYFFA